MSSKLITRVALLIFVTLVASSCAPKLVNPDFTEKLDWDKQSGLVLPVDIHGFSDGTKGVLLSGIFVTGLAASTLDENNVPRWISLQPAIKLPPFSLNLSHKMTENVKHMVDSHSTWDPAKDNHGSGLTPTALLISGLVPAVNKGLGLAEKGIRKAFKKPRFKITFKPRFLVCAHVDGSMTTVAGKSFNTANVKACLFDSKTKQYLSYTEYSSRMPWTGKWAADKAMVLGKFGTLGKSIIGKLTANLPQANK